jgi:putative membrane protein insertion efficiency factor
MRLPLLRLPQHLLMALVRAYRLLLSPWLGASCRFEPTCSAYALQALERHGAAAGSYLAVCRLARCHPWCTPGFDPVPAQTLFSSLLDSAPLRGSPASPLLPDKKLP